MEPEHFLIKLICIVIRMGVEVLDNAYHLIIVFTVSRLKKKFYKVTAQI